MSYKINDNQQKILYVLKDSYYEYLESGSRSNKKLKILHGAIANDLKNQLSKEYQIFSLSQNDSHEIKVKGKYYDKTVDIAIQKNNQIIACVGIKFIMQNYAQNANNYFENLIGETTNIQLSGVPYFNMLFLQEKIPYFNSNGEIKKFEKITAKILQKYFLLYEKQQSQHYHVPKMFFIGLLKNNVMNLNEIKHKTQFKDCFLRQKETFVFDWKSFESKSQKIIINEYELFINKLIKLVLIN